MIINSINLFPKFSLSRPVRSSAGSVFRAGSLAPLKQDTVSFSGEAKLTGENMQYAPPVKMCSQLHNNAYPAAYDLASVLKEYLDKNFNTNIDLNSVLNFDSKPNHTVRNTFNNNDAVTLKVRIKEPDSIREKTVSKFGKIARNELNNFCKAAVSEICNFYTLKPGYSKEMAVIDAETLLDTASRHWKNPPFDNEGIFLSDIISDFEVRRLIKLKEGSHLPEKAFDQMTQNLSKLSSSEHCSMPGAYIDPASSAGVKHYANDIIGARIVLNDTNPKTAQKVINALKQAVIDGRINITSVENNIPDPKKLPEGETLSSYEYLPQRKIKSLADAANAEYITNISKSGYMAIHVNLDLTKDKFASKKNEFNGYQGEIQIIGADVETLKDVEDLCYKLKDDKNAFKEKYKPFKEHFRKYYKGKKVQEAFNSYTYDLYLAQRGLPPGEYESFPSIKRLGYSGAVPEELDYNVLRNIKRKCSFEADRKSSLYA